MNKFRKKISAIPSRKGFSLRFQNKFIWSRALYKHNTNNVDFEL